MIPIYSSQYIIERIRFNFTEYYFIITGDFDFNNFKFIINFKLLYIYFLNIKQINRPTNSNSSIIYCNIKSNDLKITFNFVIITYSLKFIVLTIDYRHSALNMFVKFTSSVLHLLLSYYI